MKSICLLGGLVFLAACHMVNDPAIKPNKPPQPLQRAELALTPAAVIAQSSDSEWRLLDADNTLYLNLEAGTVIIELMPELAPLHVENTKALVRQGVFDNSQFYRVIDGFVAQGGPLFESSADRQPLDYGQYTVPSELSARIELSEEYTRFDQQDGFADETGFLHGFPIGRDLSSGESWLLHCYGALGMGRANELDSGGTELYIVNGPAQRYLDRNVTVFGRVIDGMQYIQALKRSVDMAGVVDLTGENSIQSIQVAADLPAAKIQAIEVMDTHSTSFLRLLQSRQNRTGEWFVHQHNYMDACGIPIPVRLQTIQSDK